MEKDKLAMISPADMRIIEDAQQKLSAQSGQEIALIAYKAK